MNNTFAAIASFGPNTAAARAQEYQKRLYQDESKTRAANDAVFKSERALYQALAQGAYQMVLDFEKEDREAQKAIDLAVDAELVALGATAQSNSDTLFKIVKYNLAGGKNFKLLPKPHKSALNRKTSDYAKVLRIAQLHNVPAKELADWIEANGGIQRIRLNGIETAEQKAERKEKAEAKANGLERAVQRLRGLQLATIEAFDPATWGLVGAQGGTQFVVVATLSHDGKSVVLNAALHETDALKAARVAFRDRKQAEPAEPRNMLDELIEVEDEAEEVEGV